MISCTLSIQITTGNTADLKEHHFSLTRVPCTICWKPLTCLNSPYVNLQTTLKQISLQLAQTSHYHPCVFCDWFLKLHWLVSLTGSYRELCGHLSVHISIWWVCCEPEKSFSNCIYGMKILKTTYLSSYLLLGKKLLINVKNVNQQN